MSIKTTIEHNGTEYLGEVGTICQTMLGFEGHGIFTFVLEFDFGGTGQGAGNYSLTGERAIEAMKAVLRIVGVNSWEKLRGQRAVALRTSHNGLIEGLANIDTGKCFIFSEVFGG